MRLQKYLLKEARVKQTDADVFLDEYAPTFMWNPKDGFLWSVYDKKKDNWLYYKESKKLRGRKDDNSFMEHGTILDVYDKKSNYDDVDDFIRGRINPNGKIIYIHDLGSRGMNAVDAKKFDKWVDKTVNMVYKYMDDYIR